MPSAHGKTPIPTRPPTRPIRLPLGRTNRRLSFELRTRLWMTALGLPCLCLTAAVVYLETASLPWAFAASAGCALAWTLACSFFFEQITRPLQTLSNVVAALREDDFSFRARGARRGDSLGDLALEINALAFTLQHQRSAALDAFTLVERVLTAMRTPVLAFDDDGHLRLFNAAARDAFALPAVDLIGRHASELHLSGLLEASDQSLYPTAVAAPTAAASADAPRWSVARVTFRLQGVPHTLLVLSDVASVLREEERSAWQRLIRVLGHEINNSLTPIKSIAGSLRTRLAQGSSPSVEAADLLRGLAIIEDRSTSLNRFLQAYQRLLRLPAPRLQTVSLPPLLAKIAQLETRLAVRVEPGPNVMLTCDPDQIQQALINLVQNAADAALSDDVRTEDHVPAVTLTWTTTPGEALISLEDNGAGIANPANLFVPFYTTRPNGSGIGLVLAQQIAQAHAGSVSLQPRSGQQGTRVELRLPLR